MHFKFLIPILIIALAGTHSLVSAAPPEGLELVPVASGFNRPVVARHAGDGTDRLFVVEQPGQIHIIDSGDVLLPTAFLDIRTRVENGGNEQGLLGLAFDPDYTNNRYFYVNYTYDTGRGDRTRVSRFTANSVDKNIADEDSEYVIIEIAQDYSNHNGGDIHFGQDGYLYIGMGDGGSGGDPNNRAQTLLGDLGSETLLGKMLRIDVHGTADEPEGVEKCGEVRNYKIPFATDNDQIANPWLGEDGICDEIWTYGWRNPWRFSFDRSSGDMFVGDVGQGSVEEISWQPADHAGGDNYGWNCKEGSSTFRPPLYPGDCPQSMIDPILEYLQSSAGGCAVTGGYVYRGLIASMQGDYIYSDYCNGYIWFAGETGGDWSEVLWLDTGYHPSAFGEDEAGELYLVHIGTIEGGILPGTGAIYRFVDPSMGNIFDDSFEGR